jgi:hypothetical protein
MPYYESQ